MTEPFQPFDDVLICTSVDVNFSYSEWLLFNTNSAIFQLISRREKVIFQWDDDEVCFVL